MKRLFAQIMFFVITATVLAVGRNTVAPGKISWVGEWGKPTVVEGDSIIRPASADADDPPFLTFTQARAMFEDKDNVLFVDARYPEDFETGHIPGSILLPFEMFDDYWAGVEPRLPKDKKIVTYCSGEDCELSLFLARLLRDKGYNDVAIFYGGALKWQENRMPMDTAAAPPPGV
jgi:rhodanese-related sulfurtransferase